jgi:hypothetical protein
MIVLSLNTEYKQGVERYLHDAVTRLRTKNIYIMSPLDILSAADNIENVIKIIYYK